MRARQPRRQGKLDLGYRDYQTWHSKPHIQDQIYLASLMINPIPIEYGDEEGFQTKTLLLMTRNNRIMPASRQLLGGFELGKYIKLFQIYCLVVDKKSAPRL